MNQRESERSKSELYLRHTLIPERDYFLIHHKWWGLWRAYIEDPSGTAERPGSIDNSGLVAPPAPPPTPPPPKPEEGKPETEAGEKKEPTAPAPLHLRPDLKEDVDYHVVSPQLWAMLLEWYGLADPAVVIARKVILVGVHRRAHLELFPVHVHVIDPEVISRPMSLLGSTQGREAVKQFIFARCQTVKDVRRFIGPYVGAAPHKIIITVERGTNGDTAPPGPAVRQQVLAPEEDPKTLEDLGISDGDSFRITKVMNSACGSGSGSGSGKSWGSSYVYVPETNTAGTPPAPGAVGLSNLGCTCYMNAALQCLSHTFHVSRYFVGGEYLKALSGQQQQQQQFSSFAADLYRRGQFSTKYAELLSQMWGSRYTKVVPRELKSLISQFAPRLAYSQQDSQEFLGELFAALDNDLSPPSHPGAAAAAATADLGAHSVIGQTFQGYQHSSIKCTACGYASEKVEPFLFLSVPVPSIPTREVSVVVVPRNGKVRTFSVPVLKSGQGRDLKSAVSRIAGLAPKSRVLLSDCYRGKIFNFPDEKQISQIHSSDGLIAHEVSGTSNVTVYHRKASSRDLFALPFFVSLAPVDEPPITSAVQIEAEIRRFVAMQAGVLPQQLPEFNVCLYVADKTKDTHVGLETLGESASAALAAAGGSLVIEWSEVAMAQIETMVPSEQSVWIDPEAEIRARTGGESQELQSSVRECIEYFGAEEVLDGIAWRCPLCGSSLAAGGAAVKQLRIALPVPACLIVHLKRFRSEGMFREKVKTRVDFPIGEPDGRMLDIGSCVLADGMAPAPTVLYELYGIVCHIGGLSGGHYVAYARGVDGVWRKFDDSHVAPVDNPAQVLHGDDVTTGAYMLFYQNCEAGQLATPEDMLAAAQLAAAADEPMRAADAGAASPTDLLARSTTPQQPPPPPPSPAVSSSDLRQISAEDVARRLAGVDPKSFMQQRRQQELEDDPMPLSHQLDDGNGGDEADEATLGMRGGHNRKQPAPVTRKGSSSSCTCPMCNAVQCDFEELQVHILTAHPDAEESLFK